uniref:Reverse transcriptase n=1 Tax=Chenopodium quinoa TaxID=63459 RepID=A0A803N5V4_CHEQI
MKKFEKEKNKQRIKFTGYFIVECEGEGRRRKGGLTLLWKDSIDVTVSSFSSNHVDDRVSSRLQRQWRFSVIYGHPDTEKEYKTRMLMESLRGDCDEPLLCRGDLNLMLHSGEKQGGQEFDVEEADILRNAVAHCQLEDLGYIGHEFTWSNNRGGEENIQERLDRFMANRAWRDTFKGSFVSHLTKRKSNHLPILLCIKDTPSA